LEGNGAIFPLLPNFGCVSFFLASLGVFESINLCVVKHVEFVKKLKEIKDLHKKILLVLQIENLSRLLLKVMLVDMKTNSLSIIVIFILNVFA
jgi:hypothetical protein